jgi:hypothetical protein
LAIAGSPRDDQLRDVRVRERGREHQHIVPGLVDDGDEAALLLFCTPKPVTPQPTLSPADDAALMELV